MSVTGYPAPTTIGPGVNSPPVAAMPGRTVVGSADPGTAAPDQTGAVVRDHRKTWRADAGAAMSEDEYQAWLASTRNLGVDASGTPVNTYLPPTSPLAPAGPQIGGSGGPAPGGAAMPGAAPLPAMTPIDRADYALPGGDALLAQLGDRAAGIAGRTPGGDVRNQQMALMQMLQRFANGTDSQSAIQLRQAQDAQTATQMALAAGARPGQGQLAGLTAAQNIGAAHTALGGQAAIAGIQERRQAQDALNAVLGATRGQDLQFGAQNDQAYQQALAQQLATQQLMQQGNQGYSTNLAMQQLSQQQLAQQAALAHLQAQTQLALGGKDSTGLWQSILGAGGQALGYLNQPSAPDPYSAPQQPAF